MRKTALLFIILLLAMIVLPACSPGEDPEFVELISRLEDSRYGDGYYAVRIQRNKEANIKPEEIVFLVLKTDSYKKGDRLKVDGRWKGDVLNGFNRVSYCIDGMYSDDIPVFHVKTAEYAKAEQEETQRENK